MASWQIEKLVPGGDGMARLDDGRIGFASGTVPGDVIRPTEMVAKKGHARADAWDLVRPSALRVEPPCPVATRCGGCDWMALAHEEQVRQKSAILRQALERTGGFTDLPLELPIVTAGPGLGYRSRVAFHVDVEGRIGLYGRRSHDLVEMDDCPVCRPEIVRALHSLRRIPRSLLASFSSIEVRSTLDASGVAVDLEPRARGRISAEIRAALDELPPDFFVAIAGKATRERDGDQILALPEGVRVRAAPGVFTQVNADVNLELVTEVVRGARARRASRFCDLFAGVGNFALPLLAAGLSGVAVERDARAVRSAKRAARDAGLDERAFVAEDAGRFLASMPPSEAPFDLVLVDPPRRGAKDVLGHIVRLEPRHVAMCSCDPVTLARDLATLAGAGYALGDVRGFDMFPHTHHLETLAWMERPARGA